LEQLRAAYLLGLDLSIQQHLHATVTQDFFLKCLLWQMRMRLEAKASFTEAKENALLWSL
jgi:hypothetical protein